MQDEITDNAHTARPKKRWFKRWWAWLLWISLTLILICVVIAVWAWTQRYALMEDYVVDTLAESGFDADLDIVSVSRTQAQVKNIRLRRGGQEFLRVQDLRADYIWPDVRDGKLKQLQVDGTTGRLKLGEDWQPTESWIQDLLSGGTGEGGSGKFPENGVRLTDGTLILTSPLGEATLYIDATVPTASEFKSEITLAPSDLSYAGYSAKGAGFVTLEKTEAELRVVGQTQTATLSNGKLDITDAHLQIDGRFDLDAMVYTGSVSLDGDSLSSDLFASGPARLAWDGEVSPRGDLRADGTWSVSAQNARSPRPARAAEVAETLSLFPVLSVVPVTEHYAPQMLSTVEDFILGSDVSGQGRLSYGPDGFTVNPIGPFGVNSSKNQLRLHARTGKDFYVFDQSTDLISANMDAVFDNPVGLTLTDTQLQAESNNGLQLNGIRKFETTLATQSNWHANDDMGRPVRLGPLEATMQYNALGAPRRLLIDTALDYDGELPGGYVEGLNLDGRLDVRLYKGRQVLGFAPRRGSVVTLRSLDTPTNWQGENISFTLPTTTNLFTRTGKSSVLSAKLTAANFTLTHPATDNAEPQQLDIEAEEMKLSGTLFPDKTQDWTVDFTQAGYASETLPGPGTTGSTAEASLTARLQTDQSPQITLKSPSVTGETPMVRLSNIGIDLRGTPNAYRVNHTGGTVTIIGSELAETAKKAGLTRFPANGTVEFADGVYRGQANLRVAKANNADVNVDYSYQGGVGTAEIDVPSILFTPKGLQPQTLIPAFRGKVARVEGEAQAKLKVAFSDGAITDSKGTVQLVNMSVGTAPGPITGLNTTMRFSSLLPLQTDGPQTLTMKSFNPGFPLENGVVTFNFVPEGVKVDAADWPIGNGAFALDPFTWVYAAEENRVTMRVKDVALGDFLDDIGNQKIEATGNVVGVFPIVVRGIDVLIENGHVSVPDGGLIKYDPGPSVRAYTEEEAIKVLRERRTNEYAALAQDALREFRYRELSASLDGPINGDVEIGLVFDGSNKKVLNQQPFRFDITVKGELFNIVRSFNSNAQVKSEILRNNGKLPEGTVIGK
ncbi:MAG: YdbH domain-containing protein [Litorimonas sp.]